MIGDLHGWLISLPPDWWVGFQTWVKAWGYDTV